MSHTESRYLNSDPIAEMEILEVAAVPTAVIVFQDHPMDEMTTAFDSAFQVLRRALRQVGAQVTGPSFSLHYRMPTDTASFELGVPLDKPLEEAVTTSNALTVRASALPAGQLARISHIGRYDDLGAVWDTFMQSITDSEYAPDFPFWEVYVTQPSPDTEPEMMRTDLYTRLG